jgi:hypothetical protein
MKSIARPLVIGTLIIFYATFLQGCGTTHVAGDKFAGQGPEGGISTSIPLGGGR